MSTNMELIETKTAGSGGVANFDFTTIPTTYTDLLIKFSGRATVNESGVSLQFNNNTSTSNYIYTTLQGNGSTVTRSKETNLGFIGSRINPSTFTASTFSNSEFYIPNYRNGNQKSVSIDSVNENNATLANSMFTAGVWNQTSAITSIKLYVVGGNLAEGSTASLYGISSVTSTPKATGGMVSQDNTHWYHTFATSGIFTPTQAITADYLVIAGGGGGASMVAGDEGVSAGGAGGLRSTVTVTGGGGTLESPLSLSATSYAITVGAGGAGGASNTQNIGAQGGNSTFSTVTSTGGGYGDRWWPGAVGGGAGGSGGGGNPAGTRTASPVQGFNGGFGSSNTTPRGGGGGGAGVAGGSGASGQTAAGGNGVSIPTIANATFTGINGFYAGGGGGGGHRNTAGLTNGGLGGTGGGGAGGLGSLSVATAGVSGTVNTGGGGGGAGGGSPNNVGGNGGSGLVVIRYAK